MVSPPLGPQRLGVIGAGYFRGAGPNDGVSLRSWQPPHAQSRHSLVLFVSSSWRRQHQPLRLNNPD